LYSQVALKIQATAGKKLVDFNAALKGNAEVEAIKQEVFALATTFPMPGFDVNDLKYKTL
jgi:glycine hydroxymethyltransferase